MTNAAERILAQFAGVSDDARTMIGESLEIQPAPLLSAIGSALCYPPPPARLGTMVIGRAFHRVKWDGSAALVDILGDDPPWNVIRECLIEALGGVP